MSDDIIVFNRHTKKTKRRQNLNSFKIPCNCVVYGKSGAGKTTLVSQFLLNKKYILGFNKVFIYASDLEDDALNEIIQELRTAEARLSKKFKTEFNILTVGSTLEEIIPVNELDRTETNLVIFDDLIHLSGNKGHEIIESYYVYGRHYQCCNFYITQNFFKLPRNIRCNLNYVVMMKIVSNYDIMGIWKDINAMTYKEFKEKYLQCIRKNKHGYVVIDFNSSIPDNMVRASITPVIKESYD